MKLKFLYSNVDRHGNRRHYVRRSGRYIRLSGVPGTPDFLRQYSDAVERLDFAKPGTTQAFAKGTFGWLGAQYFASAEFKALDPGSQSTRRGVIEACFREPHRDDDPDPMGNCPLVYLSAKHIKRLRDLKDGKPGAANNRKKYLSAMCGWAVEHGLLKANPCRDVRKVKNPTQGFHTWTVAEVAQFEKRHPVGTKARLALALLLYMGVRRGDVVTLGPAHVSDGWLRFVPRKTRYKRARISEKPWLPALAKIVAASQVGTETFLVTEYGKPFTAAGFGNWFRDRCNEAGLTGCTAHGLRKAGATLAAEGGATVNQLMAIFDWDTPSQARVYTEAADRKRLAGEAMPLLGAGRAERTRVLAK